MVEQARAARAALERACEGDRPFVGVECRRRRAPTRLLGSVRDVWAEHPRPCGLGQLIESFDGDASAVIESYLEDSAEQLQLATNALRDDDRTALARSVHSLKSSSRSLGAHVVASIAEEMELLARSGEGTEKLEPLLMRLRQALIQVEPRLRESAGGGDRRASA